jgi:hypothetical protein
MERFQSRVWRLRGIGKPKMNPRGELRGVVLPAGFEKAERTIEVVFNASGEIAGLLLR